MAKRLTDIVLAGVGLVLALPLLALAAVGIKLASPGPIVYRARLTGRDGRCFTMYKLRTMHVRTAEAGSVITAARDRRVFALGGILRLCKIDELPQLVNILRGDMSVVGPRPENPEIVRRHYRREHRELLAVRPGLTSPGTLFDYTHGDEIVGADDPEQRYVEHMLPLRTALDLVYVRDASWLYDARLIARTLGLIAATAAGRRRFALPPELAAAQALLRQPAIAAGAHPTFGLVESYHA